MHEECIIPSIINLVLYVFPDINLSSLSKTSKLLQKNSCSLEPDDILNMFYMLMRQKQLRAMGRVMCAPWSSYVVKRFVFWPCLPSGFQSNWSNLCSIFSVILEGFSGREESHFYRARACGGTASLNSIGSGRRVVIARREIVALLPFSV